jgi:hypothetical protein
LVGNWKRGKSIRNERAGGDMDITMMNSRRRGRGLERKWHYGHIWHRPFMLPYNIFLNLQE